VISPRPFRSSEAESLDWAGSAPVAQLDRASVYGTEGQGFESLRARLGFQVIRRLAGDASGDILDGIATSDSERRTPLATTIKTLPRYSVHEHSGYWSVFWRAGGKRYKRRLGPSRGRQKLTQAAAWKRAAELLQQHATVEAEGATFREIARDYLEWLERVRGARPSTLRDHRSLLAEPHMRAKRGERLLNGHAMRALGDRPAALIATGDVEALLATVEGTGASPRTVNKHRAIVSAVFEYGRKRRGLAHNPAAEVDKRREPRRDALEVFTVEEVEAIADAMGDDQDAELVRLAAYTGLRQGELLALRWRDVGEGAITVSRAVSSGELTGTKSHKVRHVPLVPVAAHALARLRQRRDFTGDGELVFPNWRGRPRDGGALARRFKAARDAAGARPLRFHDLRHSFGSALARDGVDVLSIKTAMGHADLATTQRYLHATQASEQVERFARAFET
jgi:integrase